MSEQARKGLRRQDASTEEVLGEYQAKEQTADKRQNRTKEEDPLLLQARINLEGKRIEAINERRNSMSIERAQKVVPGAAKLWDFASEQLSKYPDAALAFSKTREWTGKGIEENPATNYVYTIAKWQEAVLNNDDQWADEMMKRVKEMNKALHISESNLLYRSAFAEKGSNVRKEAVRATQRNKSRSRRIARDIGQGSI